MLENTLENKVRYLGTHFGGNIIGNDGRMPISGISALFAEEVTVYSPLLGEAIDVPILECSLSAKPLSSITDEDLVNACAVGYKLAFMGANPPKKWKVERRKDGGIEVIRKYSDFTFYFSEQPPLFEMYQNDDPFHFFDNVAAGDYLRSKGYALPFMGVSAKKLVEWGWLKLEA